jgi:hypothetical protein
MHPNEQFSDPLKFEKLEILRKDFFSYIDKNSAKIDSNLPVFFGHVISSLDKTFPDIDAELYDEFIDDVAFRVMDISENAVDIDFIEKICSNAIRSKRKMTGKATMNILAGLKLMKVGKYREAIDYFGTYWKHDARIGFYIAYCYYMLARQEYNTLPAGAKKPPSEMELLAREQLLEISRLQPPIYRLKQFSIRDTPFMEKAFWLILLQSLEWFPEERWFVQVGLLKAKRDNNEQMRGLLLKTATDHFYNDRFFFRELYAMKLEQRDGAGATGVVKQMMQQYPDDLEPVYYGIKLSLLSAGKASYASFREMAVEKGMPGHLVHLLDYALYIMKNDESRANIEMREVKKRYQSLHYYLIPLEYLARDVFGGDEYVQKRAKKAFFDSVDKYALEVLKVGD